MASSNGRTCEEHAHCGSVAEVDDVVVRIRKVQVVIDEEQQSALAAYWVTDGVDRCRIGLFLPRHLLHKSDRYHGRLAQIVDVYEHSESPTKRQKSHRWRGCCRAILIDSYRPTTEQQPPKKKAKRTNTNKTNT